MFNNIRAKRKSFLLFTTVAVLLTALVGYLLMHRLQTESVQSFQHSIDTWRMTLAAHSLDIDRPCCSQLELSSRVVG